MPLAFERAGHGTHEGHCRGAQRHACVPDRYADRQPRSRSDYLIKPVVAEFESECVRAVKNSTARACIALCKFELLSVAREDSERDWI